MKTSFKTIAFLSALFIALLIAGCDSSNQDPATYSNKLMILMNNNDKDMNDMNLAMASNSYQKAEDVRKTWEGHLTDAIKQAKDAGSFKGDDALKNTIVDGLNNYKKIVSNDYKQLIGIRSKGDATQQAQENNLLANINKAFEETGNHINNAAQQFQNKYAK